MLGFSLKNLWESQGAEPTLALLSEGLETGEFRPEDFSFRELAEAFCGYDWVRRLHPGYLARVGGLQRGSLMEAGDGIDVASFSNITGQILYTKIMQGWQTSVANAEKLCSTQDTVFDGEKIPWLGNVPEEGEIVRPGMVYPEAHFGERYIETPATDKRGQIVSLTKEMVFFDRTAQALKQAGSNGTRLGLNKKKRILRAALGITNNYKLNGTSYNTYDTTANDALASNAPKWCNSASSTPLADWTSVRTAYALKSKNLDPDTGNPIEFQFKQMLVTSAGAFNAKRILNATEVRSIAGGYATSGTPQQMASGNPLPEQLELIWDDFVYQLLTASVANGGLAVSASNADDYWHIGDFAEALVYMQNWPLTVMQAPANNIKEFEQDIIHRTKCSERGVISVQEPRAIFQFFNS